MPNQLAVQIRDNHFLFTDTHNRDLMGVSVYLVAINRYNLETVEHLWDEVWGGGGLLLEDLCDFALKLYHKGETIIPLVKPLTEADIRAIKISTLSADEFAGWEGAKHNMDAIFTPPPPPTTAENDTSGEPYPAVPPVRKD